LRATLFGRFKDIVLEGYDSSAAPNSSIVALGMPPPDRQARRNGIDREGLLIPRLSLTRALGPRPSAFRTGMGKRDAGQPGSRGSLESAKMLVLARRFTAWPWAGPPVAVRLWGG
jgi:hypothetical protein